MSASDASAALLVTPELWTSAAFDLRVLRYAARGQTSSSGFSRSVAANTPADANGILFLKCHYLKSKRRT